MNSFYKQPLWLQWLEAILLLIVGCCIGFLFIELTYDQPAFSFFFLLYVPIGQFTITPIFKLTGTYSYYSPMLLGYMATDNLIDLHSGSSFDFLFTMITNRVGVGIRNKLLMHHLQGLLTIISLIENGKIPKTVTISGTSYFFNERTLNKVGFELIQPSLFYRLNFVVNIVDLTWMYSLSQGRLSLPKVWKAKTASISGSKLVERKGLLENLYEKMTSRAEMPLP